VNKKIIMPSHLSKLQIIEEQRLRGLQDLVSNHGHCTQNDYRHNRNLCAVCPIKNVGKWRCKKPVRICKDIPNPSTCRGCLDLVPPKICYSNDAKVEAAKLVMFFGKVI